MAVEGEKITKSSFGEGQLIEFVFERGIVLVSSQ